MLHAVYNAVNNLHQSISGKVITSTPGSLDDAKKGGNTVKSTTNLMEEQGGVGGSVGEERMIEGGSGVEGGNGKKKLLEDEARAERARKLGKDKVTEEPRKPLAGKLLATSLAAHPTVATLTMEQRKQQIEADEAFARALEKEFELKELTVSQAGASGAPATTAALTTTTAPATSTSQAIIPAEKKKEMPPPPPPAPKQSLKRSKPDTKGEDAAAKRQKMQQAVTEKSGRFERRKRKEEERKERLKKDEEVKKKRMKKVEERIEEHFNEVRLIQSAITRSAYIPFTPEEFEACQTQALIDTCSVTLKEMTDSKRYPGNEPTSFGST